MNENILYYIWLSSAFYPGSKTPKILLENFENITDIYNGTKEDYEALGLPKSDIAVLSNKDLSTAERYLKYCLREKVGFLLYSSPEYPERLKLIDNPPPMFYYKGRIQHLDDFPCFTMVGTRSCSEKGFRLAYSVAYDASSKGAVIINGLALGIDGACIAGALDANGYAIGILGCGIDRVYPSGNKELFDRLSASGLILTEFAPFTKPEGRNFPVRNRVMSAMSLATVVFEAAEGSGALITAKHAIDQGKRIFAVPGKPYDKSYSGPLELIKDGATVFTEADDILMEYSMSFPHRINLANINEVPADKLNRLVAKYFNKDVDPDTPVNRRHVYKSGSKSSASAPLSANNEKQAEINVPESISAEFTVNPDSTTPDKSNKKYDLSLLSQLERQIYDCIKQHKSISPDEIADKGIKIEDVLSTLTLLEIFNLIEAVPGGKYSITQ